ncbi:ubiquitin carboxyl-terminal hydrolase 2-like [Ptychodera flava]|uniref:ubiquitin carboxyl-terminal hydrolase 2-like n=1 Tax=Ptychodera flava TaxID=63121 RepID=UPI00396A4827
MSYSKHSMSSPLTANYRLHSPNNMTRHIGSPSTRRRSNEVYPSKQYDSTMMYGTSRRAPAPRPLPPGPGPLYSDGRKMDRAYIKDNLRKNDTNSRTGPLPVKPVHTEKSYEYYGDKNTYNASNSPSHRGTLTKSKRTQSMTDLTSDFGRLDLHDTIPINRTSRHNRGSMTNISDIDTGKRYEMLQHSKVKDDADKKVDELFNSSYKTTYSSHFTSKTSKTSHPYTSNSGYSSSSKEPITAVYPSVLNSSRSNSLDSDSSLRERTKMTKAEPLTSYTSRRSTSSGVTNGLVGLKNLGNTCFMNSILQCLSNTRSLLEYCLKDDYEKDLNRSNSSMKGQLMTAFAELLKTMWKPHIDSPVNPSAFKTQIQRFAPRFVGYSQQDSQEFLRFLLEGLHDDINKVMKKPRYNEEIPDDIPDKEKARDAWNRYTSRENSHIVDLFVGQLKSTLMCTVCRHCSVTFDPFWDLSLPIPKPSGYSDDVSLNQCFKVFTKEEILDGDEKPTCSRCQDKRKCIKKLSIEKFPSILVLHLKRFSATKYRAKLTSMVDFPSDNLNLHEFSSSGNGPYYSLYGVSNHSGSTYGGHYTAYCKHAATREWYTFDDTRVSNMSSSRVKSSQGYVLFYEKKANEI